MRKQDVQTQNAHQCNIFIRIRTKESTLHHFQVHFYFILNKAIRQYLDYLVQLQKTIVDDLSLIPLNNL